jgi:hypothetical protein
MTQTQLLAWLLGSGAISGAAVTVAFLIAYSLKSRWWNNPAGRSLMVIATGLASVMIPLVFRFPFGIKSDSNTTFAWFRVSGFFIAASGMLWMTITLFRAPKLLKNIRKKLSYTKYSSSDHIVA